MHPKLPINSGIFLACCIFAGTAGATEPAPASPTIPRHVLQNMRVSVQHADAVAVVTLQATPQDVPGATMKLQVDQTVDGQLPAQLELPIAQFFIGDLEQGAKLLVSLQQKDGQWVGTGHYERITRGTVRDLPLQVYLAKLAETAAVRRSERRAAPAPAVALPTPGAPTPAPAVATGANGSVVPASKVSSKATPANVNVATTSSGAPPAPAK